jgi:hypothetical protein
MPLDETPTGRWRVLVLGRSARQGVCWRHHTIVMNTVGPSAGRTSQDCDEHMWAVRTGGFVLES